MKAMCAALAAMLAVAAQAEETENFTWGGRDEHPAVVNPVLGEDASAVISLRGEWEFSNGARNVPVRNGIWEHYYVRTWKDSRKISVPAVWEAQGVGEPGDGECWDPVWDNNAKPIRHKYMGEGWYRKSVKIPAAWAGKRIWIKLGGVKSVGWVWVNGRQVALVDNYCATVKYEITDLVKPGEEATVVIDVDNRKPSRKGLMSAMHRWGGIYRDVELEATPQCFIDDAWVRGDFDRREAEVKVKVEGVGVERKVSLSLRATVEDETSAVDLCSSPSPSPSPSPSSSPSPSHSDFTLKIPIRDFRPWSPEHPNLYVAKIDLIENGEVVQVRRERFGVRKIEVVGKEFRLNGKPFAVRGFGDDHVYPLTGVTPADREVHRAHLAKARKAGFNYVRLHTHCEVPEYFEAADELGIMIQPELPYYSDVPTEGFAFDPKRDVTELWRNYRRHPSFAVYSMGNEGSFGDVLDRRLHRYVKAMDPDRLKIGQDCHVPTYTPADRADFAGGPTRPWARGSFESDRPFVTHEYLNLSVKLDSRQEGRYTGAWLPPTTRGKRAAWLAQFGLDLDWGDRLQDAQHVLQGVWQKRGVESARLDPFCDGYIFWTIVDVVVWNDKAGAYSAQGLFDPFWGDKPKGLSAEQFAAFNSPSCVLVDLPQSNAVYAAGETFRADVKLAHYGDEPLRGAKAAWSLETADGRLAGGEREVGDVALGGVRPVAAFDVTVPEVEKPVKAAFRVSVGGIVNSWDLWLFPKRRAPENCRIAVAPAFVRALAGRYPGMLPTERLDKAQVVIARKDSAEAKAALAAGKNLITVDGESENPNVSLGWWWMGDQVGTAIKAHPALGDFPHEGALTPLMFRLVKKGGLVLPAADLKAEDLIIAGEGGNACFAYLAERQSGKSRILECHGLDLVSDTPEGAFLLDAFVKYLHP